MKRKAIKDKTRQTISDFKIKDYIRQLSIVVLGIIITFVGNDAITNYSKQKDIEKAMQLIKIELKKNRIQVRTMPKSINLERNSFKYILANEKSIDDLPTDTLAQFQNYPFRIGTLSYTKDAMEVLKSSSLMQQIKDKDSLIQLMATYESLNNMEYEVSVYFDLKNDYINKLNDNEKIFNMRTQTNMDYHQIWKEYLNNFYLRSLMYYSIGFFSDNHFSPVEKQINEMIKLIDEKYS